jgi:hypothetical protein
MILTVVHVELFPVPFLVFNPEFYFSYASFTMTVYAGTGKTWGFGVISLNFHWSRRKV